MDQLHRMFFFTKFKQAWWGTAVFGMYTITFGIVHCNSEKFDHNIF